jgi:hypothetical protein
MAGFMLQVAGFVIQGEFKFFQVAGFKLQVTIWQGQAVPLKSNWGYEKTVAQGNVRYESQGGN